MMFRQKGLRETYDKHHEHIVRQRIWRRKRRALALNRLKENGARIRAKAAKHRAGAKAVMVAGVAEISGRHILQDVCDDTHCYVFYLATRCHRPILGNYSQLYASDYTLYGITGWYYVKRTRLRDQGLGGECYLNVAYRHPSVQEI